jgi:MFS family permease
VLAAGLVAILLPLIEGRRLGWPAWTWLSLAVAPAILGAFVGHQSRLARRGGSALLDLGLFRERAFSAGLVAQLSLASAQASFFVYLALYLQQGRGLGALEAGLVFSILAVAYVALSGPAPRLTERFGRSVVAVGGAALAGGLALLAFAVARIGVGGSLLALVPGLLLVGAGIGLCYTPLTSTVLAGVAPSRAGAASGALSTTQQVGYALGVAVTGLIFFGAGAADVGHAFELCLLQQAALALAIVVITRLLPRPDALRDGATEPATAPARA